MGLFLLKNLFSHATLGACTLCIEMTCNIIFIYKHLLEFRSEFPIFFTMTLTWKTDRFQLMFYCVNVADKRKITDEKQNINMYSLIIIFYPVLLPEKTNSKHAFAVYLVHWFFVRLNLDYFKLHFGEKKIDTLTQFHYDPKSLHRYQS